MRMRSLLIGIAIPAVVLAVAGWFELPGRADATSDTAAPARLSVTVDNARTQVREGQTVTYTTRIRNGEQRSYQVQVTQMLPSALRVHSAAGGARVSTREVVWEITIGPGQERELAATAEVGQPRGGYDRLVSTSCIGPPGGKADSFWACSKDSDPIADGAVSSGGGRPVVAGGFGLALVSAAALVYAAAGRHSGAVRPRPGAAPTRPGAPTGSLPTGWAGSATGSPAGSGPVPGGVRRPRGPVPGQGGWAARLVGFLAACCRARAPVPSGFVRTRDGNARSPPPRDDSSSLSPR